MSERAVSQRGGALRRAIVAAAILLLGGVAATRLTFSGREAHERPALVLAVSLPDPGDPAEIAQRFAVPLESVARSLPGATSITGEVTALGVDITVRLKRGCDPEVAAARASAALATLRRDVPEGGSVTAHPLASQRDLGLIVALGGSDAETRGFEIVEALRALPGVRRVDADGLAPAEIRMTLRRGDAWLADRVGQALRRTRAAIRLGETTWADGGRALPVVITPSGASDPARAVVDVGGSPLVVESLGQVVRGRAQASSVAHVDGRRAVLVHVHATHDASIASVDRAVRRLLEERKEGSGLSSGSPRFDDVQGIATERSPDPSFRAEVIDSDAESLGRLVTRLAIAIAGASLLCLVAGFARWRWAGAWRLGLVLPLGLAAALNGLWFLGAPLDETTAPLVILAIMLALPTAMARLGGRSRGLAPIACLALVGALVPGGLHLAGGRLAPEWAHPAEAFAVALALAALTTLAWSEVPATPRRSRRAWRILRMPLSDPATTLLVAATALYVGFTLFGTALDPRAAAGSSAEGATLAMRLSFPGGTSLARTEQALQAVEDWLGARDEVERTWGRASRESAWCVASLGTDSRGAAAIARLRLLLEHQAARTGAAVRVFVGETGTSSELITEGEEEMPEADAAATRYRVIVSAPDVEGIRAGVARIGRVASEAGVKSQSQQIEWAAPTARVELAPRKGVSDSDMRALASSLVRSSTGPSRIRWPAREPTSLVVTWPGAPERDDPAPQRADLLESPRRLAGRVQVAGALATLEDRVVLSSLRREAGRFVVPVTFMFNAISEDMRRKTRDRLDTSLSLVRLPDGCEVARPPLGGLAWRPERVRLLALGLVAPLALLLAGAFMIDSLLRALVALFPLALGLVLGCATLSMTGTPFDGRAFTLIAAAACGVLPLPLALLWPARGTTWTTAKWAAVRSARRALPAVVTLAGALLVLCLATWGLDRVADAWVTALVAAAATAAGAAMTSVVVAPAATLALADLGRRRGSDGRRLRVPPAWGVEAGSAADAAPLSLAARHLTKVYPGGFRALHDVSFEFGPGIVGLLGPNGAGKTTLLRLMTGLLIPTRGEVAYRGIVVGPLNLAEYRRHLGFLPQEFNAYPGLSARQFLDYWAIERGMKRTAPREAEIELRLEEVGLTPDADRRVRDFSGGMRQRLGIARALLGSPPLLVIDEPTTGLDVEARTRFRDALLTVAAHRLVVLSTHVASDVESTASRLLLIHRGRVHFDGSPSTLIDRAKDRVVELVVDDAELAGFSRRHRVTARVRVLSGIRVRAVIRPGEPLPGAAVRPTLEEAYLAEIDVAEDRGR